jgi:NADPH:quinone reductase-like Zn-dependent oxidoreductase
MKSVFARQALPAGHPEALLDGELPEPRPGPEDLLVRVEAVAVNPADVRMRLRKADDGQPAVLGWDVAGEVLAVGAAVRGFAVGDRVLRRRAGAPRRQQRAPRGARGPGGAAPAHAVGGPGGRAATERADGLGSAYEQLGLSPEPAEAAAGAAAPGSLLIVGAAGGVGSMALQLARRVPGLQVLATASRPASRAWCLGLGAHAVLDHHADLAAQLAALGRPAPERVLLLQAPDQHYPALAALLAPQGGCAACCPSGPRPT